MNDKYDAGNGVLSVEVLSLEDLRADNTPSPSSEVLILVGIDDSLLPVRSRLLVQSFMDKAAVVDCFNCSSQYMGLRRFGEYVPPPPQSNPDSNHRHLGLVDTVGQKLDELFMGPTEQKHRVAFEVAENVWTRKSLDDLIFLVFVLVDTFTAFPVKSLQASTASKQANLKQVRRSVVSTTSYSNQINASTTTRLVWSVVLLHVQQVQSGDDRLLLGRDVSQGDGVLEQMQR